MSTIAEKLLDCNGDETSYFIIRDKFKELTGLDASIDCIQYMCKKLPTFMRDPISYATAKDLMLQEYDNYSMSHKTIDKLEYEKFMEQMADSDNKEDEYNVYYEYKGVFFEWNKYHMTEHAERGNTIANIARSLVDECKSVKVDTRKNYGEVRYIVTCFNNMVITCYRYDKSHIRIITAWKE